LLQPVGVAALEALLSKIEPLTVATEGDATHVHRGDRRHGCELRARGLMFRQRLPEDRGMLFDFESPRPVSMWMKNTYISLDMLFIREDGTIAYIAENTVPKSLDTIGVSEPVLGVLELAGGTAPGASASGQGDTVYHRMFKNKD
jgi:uncharacterized protein